MIVELIIEALLTLHANLLRTTLTMIGIILGVGAVVAIMTVGTSAYSTIETAVGDLGLGTMQIRRHYLADGGEMLPLNNAFLSQLRHEDFPDIISFDPKASGYGDQAYNADDDNLFTYINYATPADLSRQKLLAGHFFDDDDLESRSQVTVIDETTAKKLFASASQAVGQTLRLQTSGNYRVVGVVKGSALNFGASNTGDIYIPLTMVETEPYFQVYGYDNIAVGVRLGADYDRVAQSLVDYLLDTYGYLDADEMPFSVRSVRDEMQEISTFMTAFSLGLSLIAAISLVVGGVGIMNIMLVSVTERTKEIGLMKALGAQDRDIVFQFLVESMVMTVFGGLLGVLLGLGVSCGAITLANTFGQEFLPTFAFVIEYRAIIVSLLVSLAIGLVFGAYPAKQAAKLDPVVALRRD